MLCNCSLGHSALGPAGLCRRRACRLPAARDCLRLLLLLLGLRPKVSRGRGALCEGSCAAVWRCCRQASKRDAQVAQLCLLGLDRGAKRGVGLAGAEQILYQRLGTAGRRKAGRR